MKGKIFNTYFAVTAYDQELYVEKQSGKLLGELAFLYLKIPQTFPFSGKYNKSAI